MEQSNCLCINYPVNCFNESISNLYLHFNKEYFMWMIKKYKFNYMIAMGSVKTTNYNLKVGSGTALIDEYIVWFTNKHTS